jgi:L-asparagine transporter-like permease
MTWYSLHNIIIRVKKALAKGNPMTYWFQSIILWAALPLAILLVIATIDALTTVAKTTD